jgi:hypothetical protein
MDSIFSSVRVFVEVLVGILVLSLLCIAVA